PLQILLDLVFLQHLRGMTHLLDHQHGGVAIDGLIDRGHDPDIHQHLDDLSRLDSHSLRKLGHRDGLPDTDFPNHGRGWHLEGMAPLGTRRQGTRLRTPLFLVAGAHVSRDMNLLAAIACRTAIIAHSNRSCRGRRRLLACGWGGCCGRHTGGRGCLRSRRGRARFLARRLEIAPLLLLGLFFALALAALGVLACPLFGHPPGIFLGLLAGLFLFRAAAILALEPLALTTLVLDALAFAPCGLLRLAALLINLVLLLASLLLQHITLDVGALAAHLHVDGARAAL